MERLTNEVDILKTVTAVRRDEGVQWKLIKRLAEYEDLGLSPEEIKELQDQVEVLTDTVNMLSPLVVENFELKKEEREREYEKHTYKQKT